MMRRVVAVGFTPLETAGQSEKIMRSLTGFTLIELIVVVAIIAVVSAVSVTSFSTLTGDRLEADARKMVNDLCWIRQRAVATHRRHRVIFDLANERYRLFEDQDGDFLFADPAEEIKRQNLGVGINLAAPTPAQLTFSFPQGTLLEAGPDWTITLNSQGRTRQARVFRNTGYVKIE